MGKNRMAGSVEEIWHSDVHRSEQELCQGNVEIERIGDIVSGPRTIVSGEPLDKVLYLYVIEGTAHVTLSDVGMRTLCPNDALVVFPGRVASVELMAPSNRLMVMTLRGCAAVDASLRLGYWDLMSFSVQYAGNYMNEIIGRFHASPLRGRDPYVLGLVEHLLETIWLRARNASGRGEILDAVRILNRLPAAGLTTEVAASALCISRSKLNSIFLSGLGMRPGEYLTKVILARSLAMLWGTRLSIAQVAAKMGFSSASAFAAFLRRYRGQTPVAFRRMPIPVL